MTNEFKIIGIAVRTTNANGQAATDLGSKRRPIRSGDFRFGEVKNDNWRIYSPKTIIFGETDKQFKFSIQ